VSEPPKIAELLRAIPPVDANEATALVRDSTSAAAEAQGYASGNLEQLSKLSQHERNESLRDNVHNMAVCGMWIMGFMFLSGFCIMAYHYIMPERMCWLSSEQLKILTTFMFSSAVTGTAGKYIGDRL
jgi:hypothetical protein